MPIWMPYWIGLLLMRRLKKKRLALRDEIARLEQELTPDEPA